MDSRPVVAQPDVVNLPVEFGAGTVLLDVRENDEWRRGHAADARWSPTTVAPAASDLAAGCDG